jgi:putative membrane protein
MLRLHPKSTFIRKHWIRLIYFRTNKGTIMVDRSKMAATAALTLIVSVALTAAIAAGSSVDSDFVGKVSQGGMYEVEASKLAKQRATGQDVKDLAASEVHDHELVNAALKKLADAAEIPVAAELNSEFQQRLATLKGAAVKGFDAAYIDDMKQIHDKDEKLFAQEAVAGTGGFKAFAQQTDLIVKRHIGALHGLD